MSNEPYDHFVRTCANARIAELNIAQKTKLVELCRSINGNTNRSIEVETLYESFTNKLLEPIIARYWIICEKPKETSKLPHPAWYL
jgi:hypothetical protein